MKTKTIVGNCGYSYFRPAEFVGPAWRGKFSSVLQAYASLFPSVEINSTFYRIPKKTTAERWFAEASEVNRNFLFTVKASQIITHIARFKGQAFWAFERMREICGALRAKILLLQSPASFAPTSENKRAFASFLKKIDRTGLVLAWEPRGKWWRNPNEVMELCREFDLVNCVDPLRNRPQWFGTAKIAYFRLHGFGKPSMYMYDFSKKELEEINGAVRSVSKNCREAYVMFNNSNCYSNALEFMKIRPG